MHLKNNYEVKKKKLIFLVVAVLFSVLVDLDCIHYKKDFNVHILDSKADMCCFSFDIGVF